MCRAASAGPGAGHGRPTAGPADPAGDLALSEHKRNENRPMLTHISVRGAREHNLKGIDLEVRRGEILGVAGVVVVLGVRIFGNVAAMTQVGADSGVALLVALLLAAAILGFRRRAVAGR